MTHERITADDVQIGDRIGRTRNGHFPEVVAINEGEISRRFALVYVAPDVPSWLKDREEATGLNAGNIRPARTAKLWRLA